MSDLKRYFPMIRERKEVLADIHKNEKLLDMFHFWTE